MLKTVFYFRLFLCPIPGGDLYKVVHFRITDIGVNMYMKEAKINYTSVFVPFTSGDIFSDQICGYNEIPKGQSSIQKFHPE